MLYQYKLFNIYDITSFLETPFRLNNYRAVIIQILHRFPFMDIQTNHSNSYFIPHVTNISYIWKLYWSCFTITIALLSVCLKDLKIFFFEMLRDQRVMIRYSNVSCSAASAVSNSASPAGESASSIYLISSTFSERL